MSEAVQSAAISVRLILAIADAVRRAAQKHHHGQESELAPDAERMAPGWAADQLRDVLAEGVLNELMANVDWPAMAVQLASLQLAGVDMTTFLPQLGRMAAGVGRAVADNAARTRAEGTDRWAGLLKSTMPEGLVRDAILASPAWPGIAAAMGQLDARGVDVARILADAHAAGLGVDQAVAAVTTAAATTPPPAPAPAPAKAPAPAPATATVPAPARGPAPTPAPAPASAPAPGEVTADPPVPPATADAKRAWGPLTEGMVIPRDLDLGDRARALEKLGVNPAAHSRIVSLVNDALPQQEAALLVSSRQWPVLAARMQRMAQAGQPLADHLARLTPQDASWRPGPGPGSQTPGRLWPQGPPLDTTGRLLLATHHVLTTPLDQPLPTAPRVSATAARSRSTTTPTTTTPTAPTVPKPAAPAAAAVPAHRQQTAPARSTRRSR
ncbi:MULTISPECIES: hypothetical protein [unclassified Streptomyces]|uniref:hypothetical protein n=1 Tax=Streptomyces sp. NPDC055082 TaxID=3365718 RepID=UPI0037D4E3DB